MKINRLWKKRNKNNGESKSTNHNRWMQCFEPAGKKFLLPNASAVIYGSVTHNFNEFQTLQSLCHALKGTGTQPGNIFCKLLTLFSQQAAVFN